jgi:hypothetical protein
MQSWLAAGLVFAGMLIALPGRAADESLDGLMQSLAARPQGHAVFSERQFIALLKTPVDSSGDLYFRAPDHLEKITRTPVAESLIVDSGTLTVVRGAVHRSLSLTAFPQIGAFIDSIRATLAGDRQSLEKAYALTFGSDGQRWSLSLTPRDSRLASLIREIHITGAGNAIGRVEMMRADGDRSEMTITPVPEP